MVLLFAHVVTGKENLVQARVDNSGATTVSQQRIHHYTQTEQRAQEPAHCTRWMCAIAPRRRQIKPLFSHINNRSCARAISRLRTNRYYTQPCLVVRRATTIVEHEHSASRLATPHDNGNSNNNIVVNAHALVRTRVLS